MSSLYEVTVLGLDDANVDLQLKQVHPDVGDLSVARNFGLQLLLDLGRERDGETALGRALARELGSDHYSWREEDFSIIGYRYVREVRITAIQNLPPDHRGDGTIGIWWDRSSEHVGAEATYRASVRSPEWRGHIERGARIETAAYDQSYGEELERSLGIELIARESDAVILRVERLLEDSPAIGDHAAFAFQLLIERAMMGANPGGFTLSGDELANDDVLRELAGRYIRAVERRSLGDDDSRTAELRVALGETRWLSHLEPTMAWLSWGFMA